MGGAVIRLRAVHETLSTDSLPGPGEVVRSVGDGLGSVALNIGADETSMDIDSKQLMEICYPAVKDFRKDLSGFAPLLNNEKAKKLLNWQPVHKWRDYVKQ